ncbi:MAG: ferritin-like domain-containing protein [Sphingomonadales bacterium]
MSQVTTIVEAALAVLGEGDAEKKAALSQSLAAVVTAQDLPVGPALLMPDRPARPSRPELRAPRHMPKRRKGGSAENRIALLLALAHIELIAVDLAWDAAGRFGPDMPRAFALDWIGVGADEGRHFQMLADRLVDLGSYYGALPAHDGLWQAAYDTREDLAGRLSVVPLVLEARALDVSPATIERLRGFGDDASADILDVIYKDEIGHVRVGAQWFFKIAEEQSCSAEELFDASLERFFSASPKGPFNVPARRQAGLPDSLYDRAQRA